MRTLLLLAAFFQFIGMSQAQKGIPLLERSVTISVKGQPLKTVLDIISKQGAFSFSYSPDIIPADKPVDLHLREKTVREALTLLFPVFPAVKQMLAWSGIDCGPCLAPRRQLTDDETRRLRDALGRSSFAEASFSGLL